MSADHRPMVALFVGAFLLSVLGFGTLIWNATPASPANASPTTSATWAECTGLPKPIPGGGQVLNYGFAATPYGGGSTNNNTVLVAVRGTDNQIWAQPLRYVGRGLDRWDDMWYPLGGQTYGAPVVYGWSVGDLAVTDIYVQGTDGNLYVNRDLGGWSGWQYAGPGVGFGDANGYVSFYGRSYTLYRNIYDPLALGYSCR